MFFNQHVDNENGVHIHNEYYIAVKNEIRKFSGKWMELEYILFTDLTQTQKGKHHMFSLIEGFPLLIFRCEHISWSNCRKQESKTGSLIITRIGGWGAIERGITEYK